MKLFLSTSFSRKVDPVTNEVVPEFRGEVERFLATIRAAGHDVFAAIEDEGWGLGDLAPAEAAAHDIQRIHQADALVALLHDTPSAGVQWEIGYADALGKKVYIISQDGVDIGYWNRALEKLGRVTRLPYGRENADEFAAAIQKL